MRQRDQLLVSREAKRPTDSTGSIRFLHIKVISGFQLNCSFFWFVVTLYFKHSVH